MHDMVYFLLQLEHSEFRILKERMWKQYIPVWTEPFQYCYCHHHHHQWRYSLGRALASLTGFMIVIVRCGVISSTIDLVLHTLIQPSETSSSNSSGEAGKHGEKWPLNFAYERLSCL
jgi:hypothetical protein